MFQLRGNKRLPWKNLIRRKSNRIDLRPDSAHPSTIMISQHWARWISTDPDTRVGLLQAQACNMRSKCRCSCVLQFTFCHAFSSVLHRPPSQLIHCIALFLVVSLEAKKKLEKNKKLLRRLRGDDGAARLSIRIPGGIVIEPSRREKQISLGNTTTEQRPYGGRQAPGLLDTPPHHHETRWKAGATEIFV